MNTWQKIKDGQETLDKYLVREKVIDTIRLFFKRRGFKEVFTPILVPIPSTEPNLEVFKTQLCTASGKKRKAYLIMSPEYSIKKLLAAGIGNCFEITKCFRNEEEVSKLHSPEFTMLEWYRLNADYLDIMDDFEQLFIEIIGKDKFVYQGKEYDLTRPWPRITVSQAFEKYAKKNIETVPDDDFYKIFFNKVEPKLLEHPRPFFLYDYPISMASLAKPKKANPRFAERFEVFIAGIELGNCFSELRDAKEQRMRFEKEKNEREKDNKTKYPIDEELIMALGSGLPEVAGIAVGVDRLIMLAANVSTISDTILFPDSELFDL